MSKTFHLSLEQEPEFSNPDKVLFSQDGLTKADIADYYRRIAPVMLPHLEDRPLTMHRFPDGIEGEGFYHKQVSDYFPEWIKRADVFVKERRETQQQVLCNDAATLLYLVNLGMITPHIWLSRTPALNKPDKLIFDLDPPKGNFELVRYAAQQLKRRLDDLGLAAFVMTTGSKGLHVALPLQPDEDFDQVREFARHLAQSLADEHPGKLTTEVRKNKRKGRLFLDYLRNAYGQTGVAPYAVRALDGAPVATPLDWDEVSDKGLGSQTYTIRNIFKRTGQKEDPWKNFFKQRDSIKKVRERLSEAAA